MKTTIVLCSLISIVAFGQVAKLETLEGLEVSIPGSNDKRDGSTHLFGIEVRQGGRWTVMHRYSDFRGLQSKLGAQADIFRDAPFPPKFYSWSKPTLEMIGERRSALEKWLQQAVLHSSSEKSWQKPLQEFLHEEAMVTNSFKDQIRDLTNNVLHTVRDKMVGSKRDVTSQTSRREEDPTCTVGESCAMADTSQSHATDVQGEMEVVVEANATLDRATNSTDAQVERADVIEASIQPDDKTGGMNDAVDQDPKHSVEQLATLRTNVAEVATDIEEVQLSAEPAPQVNVDNIIMENHEAAIKEEIVDKKALERSIRNSQHMLRSL